MKISASSLSYRTGGLFLCFLLLMESAAAQTETRLTPTFRANSHLVLLDVVVVDKSGNPVPGLRTEDFVVKEDGKPQRIASVTPPGEKSGASAPALPRGVYSNDPAYRLPGGTPTAIVLDTANTSYDDQLYARRQMLKYLKQQYKPGQRVAIFALTDKLTLLQDFTGDPEVLRSCLEKVQAAEPAFARITQGTQPDIDALRGTTRAEQQALAAAFDRFLTSEIQYVEGQRAEVTLTALNRITGILGGLPGRKNVIWLTGGFPFTLVPDMTNSARTDLADFFDHSRALDSTASPAGYSPSLQNAQYGDRIREVAAQMATSQVAIYPVDVRGLLASGPSDIGDRQETMREVARETGGRAFVNRNDVDNGVALALRDHSATYTVGYYPANKSWDGKYRAIDLKLHRSGLETTYRRGYYAVDFAKAGAGRSEKDLSQAWQDRVPNTMVTFEATVTPTEGGKTRVEFLVDANTVSVADTAGQKTFDVGFYVGAFSPEGKLLNTQGSKLDHAFAPDAYQKILQQGMRLHLDIDPPAGSNELRLAVRDNRTGYIGSLTAAIPKKD